jgi:hypothetical protein
VWYAGATMAAVVQRRPPRGAGRGWVIAAAVPIAAAALVALYLGVVLTWSYSDGERAGILQKLSRKGWICKTYEGELALFIVPGVAPTIWNFTVRDRALVPQLEAMVGKRVVLHYEEHRGIPTRCFGDTRYFVTRARLAE